MFINPRSAGSDDESSDDDSSSEEEEAVARAPTGRGKQLRPAGRGKQLRAPSPKGAKSDSSSSAPAFRGRGGKQFGGKGMGKQFRSQA